MLKKILAVVLMLFTAAAMAAVDANKATDAQLDSVKGIGPATSKSIMAERKKNGEFKNWDDLIARVTGIGDKRAAQLSEAGLTVNGQAYKATTAKKDDKKDAKAAAKDAKKEAKVEAKADTAKPAASAAKAASAKK